MELLSIRMKDRYAGRRQADVLMLKNMGGESEAAWRAFLDAPVTRGLGTPELTIVDGAPGLEAALAALWPEVPIQRCTVHKHRNLLAHARRRSCTTRLVPTTPT